jgi:hypothetical protein
MGMVTEEGVMSRQEAAATRPSGSRPVLVAGGGGDELAGP